MLVSNAKIEINAALGRLSLPEEQERAAKLLQYLTQLSPEEQEWAVQAVHRLLPPEPSTLSDDNNILKCETWKDVRDAFETSGPAITDDSPTSRLGWIYRGHKSYTYRLQPSIERLCSEDTWALIESKCLSEFKSRARTVIEPSQLPPPDDLLGWLSVMQHYGAPTRLLDFTHSPYVALYFAIRDREEGTAYAEVWGIDADAVRERAIMAVSKSAPSPGPPQKFPPSMIDFIDLRSRLQAEQDFEKEWGDMIRHALAAAGNDTGLVAVAIPSEQNVRLSNQRGVFLFNGVEGLSFEESLTRMMNHSGRWYKRFRIHQGAIPEIEEKLFRMNIHHFSLFPDVEGLAGFIRGKIRLHWTEAQQEYWANADYEPDNFDPDP